MAAPVSRRTVGWISLLFILIHLSPACADTWNALGDGTNGAVYALAWNGTSSLYAGGEFSSAGGNAASRIAAWDGSAWTALGSGLNGTVLAIAGSSTALYAGGDFLTAGGASANHIAKWNGSAWSALGSGTNGTVSALAWDGTYVYAAGTFTSPGSNIARWDGSAWTALGSGTNGTVYALAWDGTYLYAGGDFTIAGGVSASRLARWNGVSWSALGSGASSTVYALASAGSNQLYAGGDFLSAGGNTVNRVARWDGTAWHALGGGVNSSVFALAWNGASLFAGGYFTMAGGVSASKAARWNGSAWSALSTGLNSDVDAFACNGADLYTGGLFTTAGGVWVNHVARWAETCSAPATPALLSPSNGATSQSTAPTLDWADVSGASSYDIEVCTNSGCTTVVRSASVTSSQWSVSPALNTSTTYWWRARAVSSVCGAGSWPSTWHFTTACAPPPTPSLISPSNGSTGQPAAPLLEWSNASGANAYDVQVCSDSDCTNVVRSATVSSSDWTVSPALSDSTTYWWRVRAASSACGSGSWTSAWSFTTACAVPPAPTLASPSNGATGQSTAPLLDWSDTGGGTTSYDVQVCTDSGCMIVARSANVASSQWTVTPALDNSTTYWWRARAKNSCGSGNWATTWSFTTVCVTPSLPTLLSPSNGATGQTATPVLNWSDASGATSYDVELCSDSSCLSVVRSANVGSSQWTVTPALDGSTTYYWHARANNVCASSAWTSAWSFTTACTLPAAPALLTPSNGATGQSISPVLDWSDANGATSYDVQVCSDAGCLTAVRSANVASSQWTVSPALSGSTTYWWRTRAANGCGNSSWTSAWLFATACPLPEAPALLSPPDGAVGQLAAPLLDWTDVDNATSYDVQVCADAACSDIVRSSTFLATSQWTVSPALADSAYHWRARANVSCGSGDWTTPAWTFLVGCSPAFTTQPAGVTITDGTTATLSATAMGQEPMAYQWYEGAAGDTSSPVAGANSNSFTTPPLSQTTSFWLRVSNACGSADSETATVTVIVCLFCDDFEDGILDPSWTYLKPAWSETGGSLVGTPAGKKAVALATPVFSGCSQCTVSAEMQTAGGPYNKVWLLAWYADKQDTVEVLMKQESNRWILRQRVHGVIVAKSKALIAIEPNTDYQVEVRYSAGVFTLSIDGVDAATIVATGTAFGTVGFQVKNTTGRFGYVRVF